MLMMTVVSKWTNMDSCMQGAVRTMKSTSCCVEKEFHEKMRDLKGKFSLNPILLIITLFLEFMLEIHEDMHCMHWILHVGKTIGIYIFVMNH